GLERVRQAERPDVRPAAGAGPGQDVVEAVAVEVRRERDVRPAAEVDVVDELLRDEAGGDVERPQERPAADAGRGGDDAAVVAGDEHAAGELQLVGHELGQQVPVDAAEHADVRPAALARAGDHVLDAIAVDVGRGDMNAAGERRVV